MIPPTSLCFLDTETTGLNPKYDEVIELCLLLVEYRGQGDYSVVDEYSGLRHPAKPISAVAQSIHGISPEMVRGCVLDDNRVSAIFRQAKILVAHNAGFDRSFLSVLYPEVLTMEWRCSMRGIPWKRLGTKARGLQRLLATFGLHSAVAHRAGDDTHGLVRLLMHEIGSTYPVDFLLTSGA